MTILTPTLPPHPGGVADYCALLARHWPDSAEPVRWVVATGGAESRALFPEWSIVAADELPGGWPEALATVSSGTLLVNYAQYGFAGNGMPFGLVGALCAWRHGADGGAEGETGGNLKAETGNQRGGGADGRTGGNVKPETGKLGRADARTDTMVQAFAESSSRRLAVYFHETWLTGRWWRRRAWVAPVARRLALRLAGAADVVATNCELHALQLQPTRRRPVPVLPVPANIRPRDPAALEAALRRRAAPPPAALRVVIFGLPETRLAALRAHARLLDWLLARGALAELVLLGGGADAERFAREERSWVARRLPVSLVRRAAGLPEDRISAELLAADLGLSAYGEDTLKKSGTVAALRAHGCPAGFAGHDAGGMGWNLAWSAVEEAPADWAAFHNAIERNRRLWSVEAADWGAHARQLHATVLN